VALSADPRFIEAMSDGYEMPCSARDELEGIVYFPRMCDKIRKRKTNTLHPEFHTNLGLGMDLWTCQFLGVDYHDLKREVLAGATDEQALTWAREHGVTRPDCEKDWFAAYIKTRGFRDDLAHRLADRKKEDSKTDRDDILTFMDYIEVDEGRSI
jgi:hypothetical protein|tara:strand:+ start:499 stop:963 length:465 start_codon:yes stop_codon:yes gene_type:complete